MRTAVVAVGSCALGTALGLALSADRTVPVPQVERHVDTVAVEPVAGATVDRGTVFGTYSDSLRGEPTAGLPAAGATSPPAAALPEHRRRSRAARAVSVQLDALAEATPATSELTDDSISDRSASSSKEVSERSRIAVAAMIEGFASGLAETQGTSQSPTP